MQFKLVSGVFLLLSLLFISRFFLVGQAIYGDGIYYWAYTRSIYFDYDLNLQNELAHHYSPLSNNTTTLETINSKTLSLDLSSAYRQPIGTSMLWLFFFAIAEVIAKLLSFFGFFFLLNGFSNIYQLTVGIGNIFLASIGLYLISKLLSYYFDFNVGILAFFSILFGTNLVYYISLDVINSHSLSFLLSSLFYFIFLTTSHYRKPYIYALLGILLGLMSATRLQDISHGVVVIGELIILFIRQDSKAFQKSLKDIIFPLISFTLGLAFAYSVQFLFLWSIFGNPLASPYVTVKDAFFFNSPRMLDILISRKVGVLFYSPIIIVSLLGLILLAKRIKYLGYLLFVSFIFQYYLISSWSGWHQGESYGIRMFLSSMPIFFLGLGQIFTYITTKFLYKICVLITLLSIIVNFTMIGYFHLYKHNPTQDGVREAKSTKLRKVLKEKLYNVFNN